MRKLVAIILVLAGASLAIPQQTARNAAFDKLTVRGQITSTLATGTAPLSIASTTVVPNLNAQLHNGLTAPGSAIVGISDTQTLTNKTIPAGAVANLTGQTANVGLTTLVTPAANGFYRFSGYIVETTAAATSSTLPAINISYTDADSSVAQSFNMTTINATNTVGTVGAPVSTPNYYFYAKSGVAISFQTINYLSNPASTMQFAVHVRLEGPF